MLILEECFAPGMSVRQTPHTASNNAAMNIFLGDDFRDKRAKSTGRIVRFYRDNGGKPGNDRGNRFVSRAANR